LAIGDQLATDPEHYELQHFLNGCNWHQLQNAAYTDPSQANSGVRNHILSELLKKLIHEKIELDRDFAHGDFKPENIFVEYGGDDIIADLEDALKNPQEALAFIDRCHITFIDLDNARPNDSELTYPDNGYGRGITWFPPGQRAAEKERSILADITQSTLTEVNYRNGQLFGPTKRDTRIAVVGNAENIPLPPFEKFVNQIRVGVDQSRTTLIELTNNLKLLSDEEAEQARSAQYRLTADLTNEAEGNAITAHLRKLIAAIRYAQEHPAQHNPEDEDCVFNGSVITLPQLRARISDALWEILDEETQQALDEQPIFEEEGPAPLGVQPPAAEPGPDPFRGEPWKTGGITFAAFSAGGIAAVGIAAVVTWQTAAVTAAALAGTILTACTPVGLIAAGVTVVATVLALIIKAVIKHHALRAPVLNDLEPQPAAAENNEQPVTPPKPPQMQRQRSATCLGVNGARVIRYGNAKGGRDASQSLATVSTLSARMRANRKREIEAKQAAAEAAKQLRPASIKDLLGSVSETPSTLVR